jgi:hypothetical protein
MKRGAFIFILAFSIILLSPMIFADELAQVEKAYACLEGKTNGSKCATLTFDEKVFSLLATGNCKNEVLADSLSDQCWPKAGCKIKSTAQAILALNKDIDTAKAEDWLLSKTAVPSDIDWFLEIESNGAATCTLIYPDQSTAYTLTIGVDKKISSSNLGNCLSLAQDNYWLKIAPTCYNKEIRIQCTGATNQGFITTLLFKNKDSSTVQVSETVHSASSGGTTKETVNSFCFAEGTACNYEGSLWAAFALYSSGRNSEILKFMPYLITGMSSNSKYLPEAFLSFLTGEFGTDLLLKQKAQLYWDESGNKYYDTALALLPFRYESPYEKGYSKDWLLRVQESNGCWNGGNIVDNAFILYSIWNKGVSDSGTCLFASNCIQVDCQVASCVGGVCIYDYSTECKDGDGCCNSGCTYAKDDDCEIGENECTANSDCSYFDSISDNYCSTDKTKVYQDVVEGSCKDRVCVKTETKKAIETCASSDECNSGYCEAKDNSCEFNTDCSSGVCDVYSGTCVNLMDCKDEGYFCMSSSKCPTNYLLGDEYSCSEGIFVCCSQDVEVGTCSSQGGDICESNNGESCPLDGKTTPASDVSIGDICCVGTLCQTSEPCTPACLSGQTCIDGSCVTTTEYDCTDHEGICKSECGKKEKANSAYSCESGNCCIASGGGGGSWWIWILVVLIVLALLGIAFRDKLRTSWFRLKSGMGGKKEKPRSGPGMPMTHVGPPQHPQTRMMPRGVFPPSHVGPRPLMRKPVGPRSPAKKPEESPKKGELDEVLKKLKEIGK